MAGTSLKRTGRRPSAIWLAAAVLLVAVAAYCGAVWLQSGRVLSEMAGLEARLSASILAVNEDTAEFQGDPQTAEPLAETISDARTEIEALAEEVAGVTAALPPAAAPAAAYRDALLAYVDGTLEHHARLESIATLVVERAAAIEQLSEGLGVLGELSDPEAAPEDIERVLSEARATVDEAIEAVEAIMAAADSPAYSSDALLLRLRGLSAALAGIEVSVTERDAEQLSVASSSFARLIEAEWGPLFFEASQEGVEAVAGGVEELVSLRSEVEQARAPLARIRSAAGFFAIAVLVVVLLLSAILVLR